MDSCLRGDDGAGMKQIAKIISCVAMSLLPQIASANSSASSRVSQVWHGFYGGAHVGISQSTYQNTISTPASKFDVNVTPLSGGLFGGFNWQMNQIVLGAEVDVSLTK